MRVLLTGIAGTGKSTITQALVKRGINSIDLHDIPHIFFWEDKVTKEEVPYTPVHSQDWFDTVDRVCDIPKLKELLNQYEDVIVAGSTSGSNQREFFSLFDKIVLLQATPETILDRMETRANKSGFGKTKAEQDDNLEWQKEYDPLLISLGAIPVNTDRPIDLVLEDIINMLGLVSKS